MPAWNSKQICWRCYADRSDNSYKDGSGAANWRHNRKPWHVFLQEIKDSGLNLSPLCSAPGFEVFMIVLDWLHIVDLGIAQDLIGSLFAEYIRDGPATKKDNLKELWGRLLTFYREMKVPCRLDNLTEEMFQRSGKAPKLHAKGGETRQLIPFAALLASEMAARHQTPYWITIGAVFDLLLSCCKHISSRPFVPEALADCSRKLCILWSSLENKAVAEGKLLWVKKPKVHLFQELCEFQVKEFGTPENFWTYRDESWCGHMSSAAKRRGGQKHASTVPERLLNRFRAMQKEGQEIAL